MNKTTLSVIMTNYNHARYLPVSLDAILAQEYQPFEILIIDDASTDNSVKLLRRYEAKHPHIKVYENHKNMGVILNTNRLIEMSAGDYIFAAGADDLILPGFFKKSMALLDLYPEAGLCSTLSRTIASDNRDMGPCLFPIISRRACYISPVKARDILSRYHLWIQGHTVIFKKETIMAQGCLPPALASYSDAFLWQVMALKYGVCFVPEYLTGWRQMESGFAGQNLRNLEKSFTMQKLVLDLMNNLYKGLFPARYIREWERSWRFRIAKAALINLAAEQSQFLELTRQRCLNPDSLADRLLIYSTDLLFKIKVFLIKSFLFLRLKSLTRLAAGQWRLLFIKPYRKRSQGTESALLSAYPHTDV